MMSISAVVIGRNEQALLPACLRSILAAAEEVGGLDLLYVDSASSDQSVEAALGLGARVLSLRPEWGLSPAAGRYVGYHHTGGELVLFVDADTVVERGFLREAAGWFERDEGVVGLSG